MKKFYVAVKAFVRDERGFVLLGKEYKTGDRWGLPGGRVDGNETFESTLKRELTEELPGIADISIGELVGTHRLPIDVEENTSIVFLYYVVDATLPQPIRITDEHESYVQVGSIETVPEGIPDNILAMLRSQL